MKIGVVGATGLVGQKFLKLLSRFSEPVEELRLFSRKKTSLVFKGGRADTRPLTAGCFSGLDICFFSAGADVSRKWAEEAVRQKVIVIDNSSAFRRDPKVPLVTPEVNGRILKYKPQIISNPNCTTIQLVTALFPLHRAFQLKSVRVIGLQSVSGAGKKALESLREESLAVLEGRESYEKEEPTFAFNCIPFIGNINDRGFCEEEEKIMAESKKIMNLPGLKISAFTVRVPTLNAHSLALWLTFKNPPAGALAFREAFSGCAPRLKIQGEGEAISHGRMASGKHPVFVGRIHPDPVERGGWIVWITADNLLKGAALNGLQIAEKLVTLKKETAPGG